MATDETTVDECARQLILIARDLRSAGDVPLVEFTEDGLVPSIITLAGELELIALRLDFEGCVANVEAEKCRCRGIGWIFVSEHGCNGTESSCLETCPVPVQVPCPDCAEPPTSNAPNDEVPF